MQQQQQQQQPNIPFLLVQPAPYSRHPKQGQDGVRYIRDGVRQILGCMGVKHRHAYKVAHLVFQRVSTQLPELAKPHHRRSPVCMHWAVWPHSNGEVCVSLPRSDFHELLCSCMAEYNYKCTPSSDELKVACSLRERRKCVVVLICGTSGSGKSTLASILASRLGITTIISTDSIRHMLRSFTSKDESPLLYASTYQAGDALPPSFRTASSKQQPAQQQPGTSQQQQQQQQQQPAEGEGGTTGSALERAILGYKAQCEPVVHRLDALITDFEARKQSLVVEGVHLSISLVIKLMQRHPSVVPFLVYIKNEAKHVERMAVRAKYMTLDPQKNRYVAHMRCIRWIQDYLVRKADLHSIPKIENSNVDQSVGLIHIALTGMLRRTMRGEAVLDPQSNTTRVLQAELRSAAESLSTTFKGIVEQVRTMRLADTAHAASASAPLFSTPAPPPALLNAGAQEGPARGSSFTTAVAGADAVAGAAHVPAHDHSSAAADPGAQQRPSYPASTASAATAATPLPMPTPTGGHHAYMATSSAAAEGTDPIACSFVSPAFEEAQLLPAETVPIPLSSLDPEVVGGLGGTLCCEPSTAEEFITASSVGEERAAAKFASMSAATAAAAAAAGCGGANAAPAPVPMLSSGWSPNSNYTVQEQGQTNPWQPPAFAFRGLGTVTGGMGSAGPASFALPLLDTAPKPSRPADTPGALPDAAASRTHRAPSLLTPRLQQQQQHMQGAAAHVSASCAGGAAGAPAAGSASQSQLGILSPVVGSPAISSQPHKPCLACTSISSSDVQVHAQPPASLLNPDDGACDMAQQQQQQQQWHKEQQHCKEQQLDAARAVQGTEDLQQLPDQGWQLSVQAPPQQPLHPSYHPRDGVGGLGASGVYAGVGAGAGAGVGAGVYAGLRPGVGTGVGAGAGAGEGAGVGAGAGAGSHARVGASARASVDAGVQVSTGTQKEAGVRTGLEFDEGARVGAAVAEVGAHMRTVPDAVRAQTSAAPLHTAPFSEAASAQAGFISSGAAAAADAERASGVPEQQQQQQHLHLSTFHPPQTSDQQLGAANRTTITSLEVQFSSGLDERQPQQQQQQQQQRMPCLQEQECEGVNSPYVEHGQGGIGSSSISSKVASVEDMERDDVFSEDSVAMPRPSSRSSCMPPATSPSSLARAHVPLHHHQHHFNHHRHQMQPPQQHQAQQQQQQQQLPWRSTRWIGRRGAKLGAHRSHTTPPTGDIPTQPLQLQHPSHESHAATAQPASATSSASTPPRAPPGSAAHLSLPLQGTEGSSMAAGAMGERCAPQNGPSKWTESSSTATASVKGGQPPLQDACRLLNSDEEEEDEALAAMCCAAAGGPGVVGGSGGAGRGPLVLEGDFPAGDSVSMIQGTCFNTPPAWMQRSPGFVVGNSESEAEPSYMLMGYGSLAESTAAYDDVTEDGEDQHSKMSSPWPSNTNLISRLHRHGSNRGSSPALTHTTSPRLTPQPSSPPLSPARAVALSSTLGSDPSTHQADRSADGTDGINAGTMPAQTQEAEPAQQQIQQHPAAEASSSRSEGTEQAEVGDRWAGRSAAALANSSASDAAGAAAAARHGGPQHSIHEASQHQYQEQQQQQQQQQEGLLQQSQQQHHPHHPPSPRLILRSSNSTIVRHLAGAMARSRMRANAQNPHSSLHLPSPSPPTLHPGDASKAPLAATATAAAAALLAPEGMSRKPKSSSCINSAPTTPSRSANKTFEYSTLPTPAIPRHPQQPDLPAGAHKTFSQLPALGCSGNSSRAEVRQQQAAAAAAAAEAHSEALHVQAAEELLRSAGATIKSSSRHRAAVLRGCMQ